MNDTKSVAEQCRDVVSDSITDLWDAVALVDSALAKVLDHGGYDNSLLSLIRMASERLHKLDEALSHAI